MKAEIWGLPLRQRRESDVWSQRIEYTMNRKRTFLLRPMSTRSNHIDFSPYWGKFHIIVIQFWQPLSLCWILRFDLQSDLASSQTIAMMLRLLFVICPKPHAHKNCYKSNRTIFFKVESPIFHLSDAQAWCKFMVEILGANSWCKFLVIHRPGTNSWWYTGLAQILGDTQAWCKLLQSF